ncbi:MAG TPA: hypothetical protein VLK33_05845, partial [Terriglobales bacterium]|nr:hypothetical protein [Terriglobales bacterium]
NFFGIPLATAAARDLGDLRNARQGEADKMRLLCRADILLRLVKDFERTQEHCKWWKEKVHSVFVYSDGEVKTLEKLVSVLTGHLSPRIRPDSRLKKLTVTDQLNDFCKTMEGLEIRPSTTTDQLVLDLSGASERRMDIISTDSGAVFVRFQYEGVFVFLSTSREIVNLDAELTSQNFDVREHFLSAVPVALYLKWAFPETCWAAPETSACLIIDDPALKRSHGFVDFRKLLALMKKHNFSTNIAFIPWNYRRSAPTIAKLFRDNPANYSLSVHGCDHTREEFGSSDRNRLFAKAQLAIKRMNDHELDTGIVHDRVMVFPQGVFSNAGVEALRHTSFIGAVNNDVVSTDRPTEHITIGDVWDIAVMRYSTFPIFTRRYPWEGVENFAFDMLLGKPALIVIHHDYCSDGCQRLIKFIDGLNRLKCSLTWRNLSEALRRSYRQRKLSRDLTAVEMYGREIRLENRSECPEGYLVTRRESESSSVRGVSNGSGKVNYGFQEGRIEFEVNLAPGESRIVEINYRELNANGAHGPTLTEKANATVRRYLCEFRDNYVDPARYRLSHLLSPNRN